MPTIRGKIESSGTSDFEKDGKKMTRWFIKMPGADKQISGFGAMPDVIKTAITNKEEIDIEYHIKGDYWNYGPQPEGKGGWAKKTDPEQYAQMMRMSVIKFLGMLQESLDTPFDKKNEQCKKVFDFWYAVVSKGDEKVELPKTEAEPTIAKPKAEPEEPESSGVEKTENTSNENEDAEAFM